MGLAALAGVLAAPIQQVSALMGVNLGRVGFLAETATDYNPRPIKRGVVLSEFLLCNKVPPPPPEALSKGHGR